MASELGEAQHRILSKVKGFGTCGARVEGSRSFSSRVVRSSLDRSRPRWVPGPFGTDSERRPSIRESGCWETQPKSGGKLHPRLNTGTSPIIDWYCEGKLKRTLERVQEKVKPPRGKRVGLFTVIAGLGVQSDAAATALKAVCGHCPSDPLGETGVLLLCSRHRRRRSGRGRRSVRRGGCCCRYRLFLLPLPRSPAPSFHT